MPRRSVFLPFTCCLVLGFVLPVVPLNGASDEIKKSTMAGYLLVPHDQVEETYNAGFSMYVAAWPLMEVYPGRRFQTGLFGTWMHAQDDGPKTEEKKYSDIEGGLGWWRATRFATTTPAFHMGGVTLNFSEWCNGPGCGSGRGDSPGRRDWNNPKGKYGVAQLSPWVLWPPDGLNLKQGACGELFGYGYLPLPLTEPKSTTEGKDVPTGNHSWTLFLNSGNFKGPVTFFVPYFFSRATVENPHLAGQFLDSRPSKPNRAIQMETQYIPAVEATDKDGEVYARVAPTSFPRNSNDDSVVMHHAATYNKKALWDGVKAWFDGGDPVSGAIDADESSLYKFPGKGGATWKIYQSSVPKEERARLDWTSFATPIAPGPYSFGFKWDYDLAKKKDTKDGPLVTLPEYYHFAKGDNGKPKWLVVAPEDVPAETGLTDIEFTRPVEEAPETYETPDDPESCWKKPGPVAGPFTARPGDGSVLTYYWYRFADQPTMLNADMTDTEREAVQKRVEKLHKNWTKGRDYLPPPAIGELADIDPALIVEPPPGLEVGYVPIATRQALDE